MIENDCHARGYTYVGGVPIEFLEPLAEPPWTAFVCGLGHEIASQTMVLEHPRGDIFSANFSARLLTESWLSTGPINSFTYSITGVRLTPSAPMEQIADYVSGLKLRNGLRVVMRGDCVYAMVKPSGITVLALSDRRRMQLMQAMRCVVEGRFSDATHLLSELSCHSSTTTWFGLPLGILAGMTYVGFMIKHGSLPMLISLAVLLAILGGVALRTASNRSALEAYLARRRG